MPKTGAWPKMAARDMIDLAGSSSEDEGEDGGRSPDLLSTMHTTVPSRARKRSHNHDRKRAADIDLAPADVSSSPSLSPARMTKSKKEKNQEARMRARRWSDDRKRPAATADGSKEVVNLLSPAPASPARGSINNGRRKARGRGAAISSPTPKKMSKSEIREARARARRWHDSRHPNRRATNTTSEENTDDEDIEEVVNLSSPVRIFNQQQDQPSNMTSATDSRETQQQRRSSAYRMGESTFTEMQQPSPRAARSFAAASGSRARESQREEARQVAAAASSSRTRETRREETEQWSCTKCTLLNPRHLSRCSICHHENATRRVANSEGAVYDVDGDGNFIPENQTADRRTARRISNNSDGPYDVPVRTDRRSNQRPSNNPTFRPAPRGAESGASYARNHNFPSGVMRGNMNRGLALEMLHQSIASSRNDGWGRSRSLISNSHGASRNDRSMMFSQLLQSMGPQYSNAFRQMHGSRESVDNMSYERLLEVFGDGSENRGASSRAISSLPVSTIGDPERELPEDKRECSICLEEFSRGDERTSLPCLHGFHSACINRWLSSNGTCPVCKTSVSGSG